MGHQIKSGQILAFLSTNGQERGKKGEENKRYSTPFSVSALFVFGRGIEIFFA
jgi:hypothetical protein